MYYSMKHKAHGLKYEIGVRRDGLICWIYGPIPGSVHDITIVRQGGLQNELLPGEFVLGDKGYVGEAWILTPFKGAQLTDGQRGWNHTIHSLRSQVEITIGWIKKFHAFSARWRHSHAKNAMMFRVCCNLVNLSIKTRV